MAPKEFFSFLAETYSRFKTVSKETIIEETILGLINSKLLKEEDRSLIVSTFLIDVPHSFPIPFIGRDNAIKTFSHFYQNVKSIHEEDLGVGNTRLAIWTIR